MTYGGVSLLSSLHIENIAVIECTDIEFGDGLNILTGETGAGKSVIIGAIEAVLGNRISKELIRYGADCAVVSAVFTGLSKENISFVKTLGYECEDGSVLVYREFSTNGKNICKINGRPATVSILRSVGKELVDVYGQNDSYSLCDTSTHINYIDSFGNHLSMLSDYESVYDEMVKLSKKIELISKNNKDNIVRADILRYQINELETANLVSGEMDRLNKQKEICINAEKIRNSVNEMYTILNGDECSLGAVQEIERTVDLVSKIMYYSGDLEGLYNRMSAVFYELQECALDVQNFNDKFEYDDFELDNIEQRLDLLYKLSMKYGNSTDEMIEYLNRAKKELSEIEVSDEERNGLNSEYEKLKATAKKLASEISCKRHKVSKIFEKKVSDELKFLDMPNTEVKVSIEGDELCRTGFDRVEIIASLNKGDVFKPIAKIASGGELSRLMLTIKNVLCDDAGLSTLIFDEIDTGVSGSAAQKIGLKLKELSHKKQVICITHLAQIACLGDNHFLIKKFLKNGGTSTAIKKLNFDERCKEIARIIEGNNTSEITLKNAEEMLKRAQNFLYKE